MATYNISITANSDRKLDDELIDDLYEALGGLGFTGVAIGLNRTPSEKERYTVDL